MDNIRLQAIKTRLKSLLKQLDNVGDILFCVGLHRQVFIVHLGIQQ